MKRLVFFFSAFLLLASFVHADFGESNENDSGDFDDDDYEVDDDDIRSQADQAVRNTLGSGYRIDRIGGSKSFVSVALFVHLLFNTNMLPFWQCLLINALTFVYQSNMQ